MSYPGGKASDGVYQTIINQIPPHDVYIEAFAGNAAILRRKAPARSSIAIDIDERSCARLAADIPAATVINGDAIKWLQNSTWQGNEFVYLDPPYLASTRKSPRDIYEHEFKNEGNHQTLIWLLCAIDRNNPGVKLMISGYPNLMYTNTLCPRGWRILTYTGHTRRGPVTEAIWMNYAEPTQLADYQHIGDNYRERERIKRKKARWVARLTNMHPLERAALLEAIQATADTTTNDDTADARPR